MMISSYLFETRVYHLYPESLGQKQQQQQQQKKNETKKNI